MGDVYEFLWENNIDIAYETIRGDFLIQMQNGSLQAERYVNFTIQDMNYALKVADMLKKMSANVTLSADFKDFFKGRYLSYKGLGDLMLKLYWFEVRINNNKDFKRFKLVLNWLKMLYTPQGEPHIQQTPAMRKYLSFYKKLMHNEKPLYFAVGLLPCSRLWGWLADHLNIPPTNAYYTWKEENMGSHPEKHYKALLNKHLYTPEKVAKANAVFRAQMQNEHDFFLSSWVVVREKCCK